MTRSYICLDNSEKFRNLEEAIRGLTKDLHSMQTTINGINQRLYVKASVALVPCLTSFLLLNGIQTICLLLKPGEAHCCTLQV